MWLRRRKHDPPPPTQVEAIEAVAAAQRELDDAHRMHEAALTLTDKLAQIRQRNHFGQSLENLNWSKQ